MANSILPPDGLSQLLGQSGNQGSSIKDIIKAKQEADNLEKGFPPQQESDEYSPSSKGVRAAAAFQHYQAAYQYSETMTLNLKTREGDEVSVDFRQLFAHYESYKEGRAAEEGPKGARYFESREALEATQFEEQFGFSVQGDLNEEELEAIYNVFEQVEELATTFFDGDIESAFQQAVEMEIDFGQLQSFDLNLQRTETVAVSYQQAAAYQGVQQASQTQGEGEEADATVADLPPYIQRMQAAVAEMDKFFEEARTAVEEFMAEIQAQRSPDRDPQTWLDRIRSLHDQLFEKVGLDGQTLAPSGVQVEPVVNQAEASEVVGENTDSTTAEDKSVVE